MVETLNGFFDPKEDAALLAVMLAEEFPRASLYYERRSTRKFALWQRFLLAGDAAAAAASLVEDMERAAALAAARMADFAPESEGALVLLLPDACRELSAAPEEQRMRRRIGRLTESPEVWASAAPVR